MPFAALSLGKWLSGSPVLRHAVRHSWRPLSPHQPLLASASSLWVPPGGVPKEMSTPQVFYIPQVPHHPLRGQSAITCHPSLAHASDPCSLLVPLCTC